MQKIKLEQKSIDYLRTLEGLTKDALVDKAKELFFLRTNLVLEDRELMISAMVTEEAKGLAKEYLEAEEEGFESYEKEELKQFMQQIVVVRSLHKDIVQKAVEHDDLDEWEPTLFFSLLDSLMQGFHESSINLEALKASLSGPLH